MSRRLVVTFLVALALPALALANHTDPKKQISPGDQRKAASIALKRSDFVTGWKKQPNTPDSNDHDNCPGYDPNQSDLVLTGEVEAEFASGGGIPSVSSVVNVYKTKSDAVAAWTRSSKPALAPCLGRLFKQAIEEEGGKATVVTSGRLAFPKLAPRTDAYRIVISITVTDGGKQTKVPVTVHFVALGHGRGDAVLLAIGPGTGIAVADLRAFAKLTAARLAAAKL